VVRSGTWLYDESVPRPVYLVQLDYDFWYEVAKADGMLQPNEQADLNADGVLYYVCFRDVPPEPPIWVDSPGFASLELAAGHAQARVPSPITWASRADH